MRNNKNIGESGKAIEDQREQKTENHQRDKKTYRRKLYKDRK